MNEARFRFYAKLNNFLPQENRGKELTRYFNVSGSVKDFVESFGVPHTDKGQERLSRLPELPARLLGGIAS